MDQGERERRDDSVYRGTFKEYYKQIAFRFSHVIHILFQWARTLRLNGPTIPLTLGGVAPKFRPPAIIVMQNYGRSEPDISCGARSPRDAFSQIRTGTSRLCGMTRPAAALDENECSARAWPMYYVFL